MIRLMGYIKSAALEETGYVVLDRYNQELDPKEWLDIEYVDWKSSGETRFAPLASAKGEIEVQRLLEPQAAAHRQGRRLDPVAGGEGAEPGAPRPGAGRERRPLPRHRAAAQHLRGLPVQPAPGRQQPAQPGRHRLGRARLLQPHRRRDSYFVLRDNRTDPSVEYRIALPAGAQLIVDTQRLWHATTLNSPTPRYCLITSWESGPELDAYIAKYNGVSRVPNVEVPQDILDAGQAEQARRLAARAAYYAAKGQAEVAAKSEA